MRITGGGWSDANANLTTHDEFPSYNLKLDRRFFIQDVPPSRVLETAKVIVGQPFVRNLCLGLYRLEYL
jgi:hypothetical protein